MATRSTPAVSVVRRGKLVRDVTTGLSTDSENQAVMKPRKGRKIEITENTRSELAKIKRQSRKWEERVWHNTTAGRFTRMKRKERFVHSVKSIVDALTQKGLVNVPEELLTSLYDSGMLTKRELRRLISITPPKPLKVKPIKFR